MQSLFDSNPRSQAEVKHSDSPVLRVIVFLLLAILGVGGWGVYRYEQELASGVTSKAANDGHFKTGQRKWPGTSLFYSAAS
jgi:hypothetical protein